MQNNLAQKGGEEVGLSTQKNAEGGGRLFTGRKPTQRHKDTKVLTSGCFYKGDLHIQTSDATLLSDTVFTFKFSHHRNVLPQSLQ